MGNTALIVGVSGQDGAYLSRCLLEAGYRVVGTTRQITPERFARLAYLGIVEDVEPYACDVTEATGVARMIEKIKPDEVYNLAGESFVGSAFAKPISTIEVNAIGSVLLLEGIRLASPATRFYQASTSEMFGDTKEAPQTETTPFLPRNPYGAAKLAAHYFAVNYREVHAMFCVSGILFNHESPLRGPEFVTRRITVGLAKVKHGLCKHLTLGNLNAERDWGYAGDYVDGIWRMMQQDEAGDFVLATGVQTSVRRFVDLAAPHFGFDIEWAGEGSDEVGIDRRSGRRIVKVDPDRYRPADTSVLYGLPKKAKERLGWRHKVDVAALAAMMAAEDDRRIRDGVAW